MCPFSGAFGMPAETFLRLPQQLAPLGVLMITSERGTQPVVMGIVGILSQQSDSVQILRSLSDDLGTPWPRGNETSGYQIRPAALPPWTPAAGMQAARHRASIRLDWSAEKLTGGVLVRRTVLQVD